MKPEWQGHIRFGIVLFVLYLAIHYWSNIAHLLLLAFGAAFPLLLGCVIAYVVNILMCVYERFWFPNSKSRYAVALRRPVCLVLSFVSLFTLLFLLVRTILPELAQSIGLLVRELVPLLEQVTAKLNENMDLSQILNSSGLTAADGSIDWNATLTSALKWLIAGLGGVMGSVVSLVSMLSSTAFTLIVSLIFSIYLLVGKETLARQMNRAMKAYLKPVWYEKLIYVLTTLNTCFHRFIVGQCTEAIVLGLLCIAGMLLFGFPYATMVGTLIGFTALIPVAGAYIGAGVGAFLIFTVSPVKALLFLLFIVVLQQLEGNLIYPKVVGSSIGLPGIWVLAAVTIGGGMLGIFGMLLAVPLAATTYQILRRDVAKRCDAEICEQPSPVEEEHECSE